MKKGKVASVLSFGLSLLLLFDLNTEAGNLKKSYINISKESQAQTSDLTTLNYSGMKNTVEAGIRGSGTVSDPYQIISEDGLNKVRNNLSASYVLMNDIYLTKFNTSYGWLPIQNFTGTFDGQGYQIHNLYINRPTENSVGIFGETFGKLKNVGVVNPNVTGNSLVGTLAGRILNSGALIENAYATNVKVKGDWSTGGLVGYVYNGANVKIAYSSGEVVGRDRTGGLIGELYTNGHLENAYSTASVTTKSTGPYNGGLAGLNNNGSTITNSYSTGKVTYGGDSTYAQYAGGLVGLNTGSTVTNSYWNKETSGYTSSSGGTGKTTAEMKNQGTYAGFDFNSVWMMGKEGYPVIKK